MNEEAPWRSETIILVVLHFNISHQFYTYYTPFRIENITLLMIVRSYDSFLEVQHRLQHSTSHINTSNNQLSYHHVHKLTRTLVWLAFFVCTQFDSDINKRTAMLCTVTTVQSVRSLRTVLLLHFPKESSCQNLNFFISHHTQNTLCRSAHARSWSWFRTYVSGIWLHHHFKLITSLRKPLSLQTIPSSEVVQCPL